MIIEQVTNKVFTVFSLKETFLDTNNFFSVSTLSNGKISLSILIYVI